MFGTATVHHYLTRLFARLYPACACSKQRVGVRLDNPYAPAFKLVHWRSRSGVPCCSKNFSFHCCKQSLGPVQGSLDNRGRPQRSRTTTPYPPRSPSPRRARHRVEHDGYRTRYEDRRSRSPPPRFPAAPRSQGFQAGAGSSTHPACAVCLGRHTHDVSECKASSTWDGKHTTFAQRRGGVLTTYGGKGICKDFQTRRGCSHRSHPERHICSGCGERDHGAQDCPRAQRRD